MNEPRSVLIVRIARSVGSVKVLEEPNDQLGIPKATGMELLHVIDPADLQTLMECEHSDLLGRIVELNRTDRYRNGLNALLLAGMVIEMKAAVAPKDEDRSERREATLPPRPLVLPIRPDR